MFSDQNRFTVDLNTSRDALLLVDQTKLPCEIEVLTLRSTSEIYEAIKTLKVRGAPAIGIAAAIAMYLAARKLPNNLSPEEALASLDQTSAYLASSRPTAVNLSWALRRMLACVRQFAHEGIESLKEKMLSECLAIQGEDEMMCKAIGENALTLLKPECGILTHCNAGYLAASRYGTALAPIYLGYERGCRFKIYADETRPLLQGARLTAFELKRSGVDVTLICDNMASYVMKHGLVDAVIVGADRIAKNGDVANKIGTSGVAVLAKYYGIPFYVCAPGNTFDPSCTSGTNIEIEHRDEKEITEMWYQKRMAPTGIRALNPAFDITDASLITAIVTEKGVHHPPFCF